MSKYLSGYNIDLELKIIEQRMIKLATIRRKIVNLKRRKHNRAESRPANFINTSN